MIYNFSNLGGVSDIYKISTNCGIYDGYDSVTAESEEEAESYNYIYVVPKAENSREKEQRCKL